MNKRTSSWSPELAKKFMEICDQSLKSTVDWAAFRIYDKKGIFEGLNNAKLSMKFRRYNLIKQGLCWYCGLCEIEIPSNSLCLECNEKVKKTNKDWREKENGDKN